MNKFERLNDVLSDSAPAAFAMLSDLGKRAAFPAGVPAQAAEAKGCEVNGSIGQVTDGNGNAVPLPSIAGFFNGSHLNTAMLYPPQLGLPQLREAWARRTAQRAGIGRLADPMVTVALTHGVSLCADLFSDPDTTVLIPAPSWGNYKAIFNLRRGAQLKAWTVAGEGPGLNTAAFRAAVESTPGRLLVLLNFPSNPTGYSPTQQEVDEIVEVLSERKEPFVVVVDDAYQGFIHEPDAYPHSIFYHSLRNWTLATPYL